MVQIKVTSLFKNIYSLIWPRWVLSCGMQDLAVAACGIQLPDQGPPALGARGLSHWATREISPK